MNTSAKKLLVTSCLMAIAGGAFAQAGGAGAGETAIDGAGTGATAGGVTNGRGAAGGAIGGAAVPGGAMVRPTVPRNGVGVGVGYGNPGMPGTGSGQIPRDGTNGTGVYPPQPGSTPPNGE